VGKETVGFFKGCTKSKGGESHSRPNVEGVNRSYFLQLEGGPRNNRWEGGTGGNDFGEPQGEPEHEGVRAFSIYAGSNDGKKKKKKEDRISTQNDNGQRVKTGLPISGGSSSEDQSKGGHIPPTANP